MSASFGRYRLLDRIGQGSVAEVFKAKSFGVEGFEKVLVIKRLFPDLAQHKEFVDAFIREARLAVRLAHANIVQVFDLGVVPGASTDGVAEPDSYFAAMEYVHGISLGTLLARCRHKQLALPIELAVFVVAEAAKGLDHAHRRRDDQLKPLGIVHRDLSPENLLLSFEGEVKLTDFGLAKARASLPGLGSDGVRGQKLQGKFGYMSPEQARAEAVDARGDLFALGVLLYECIAGVAPFAAPSAFETLRRAQTCEFPPIERMRDELPKELSALLGTVLARDPSARFPSAGKLYEALLSLLYAQRSRFGTHDLAEFLKHLRAGDEVTSTSVAAAMPESLVNPEAAPQSPKALAEGPVSRRVPPPLPSRKPPPPPPSRPASAPDMRPIDRAAELGELREVTALVLLVPDEVEERARDVVERYGGSFIATPKGAIAALFGLHEPDGRDAEMATRCALLVLRLSEGGKPANAGVDIGRVHVSGDGRVTADEALRKLLVGAETMARLCEGRCAVSPNAYAQLEALFAMEPLDDAALVRSVRGPGDAFGRFVGRKNELRRIGEVIAFSTKRLARLVTLRGDQGIGKTRLLFEVRRRLRKGNYNIGFHVASCLPRGRETPLSGIVCMLQALCGVTDGDPADRLLAVQPRLRALGLAEEEVSAVLAALGASVQLPVGNAKALLRSAFARMTTSLCEDRPHVFAWDSAHWMDEDSFLLLETAFHKLSSARVVLLFVARAGFTHPLEKLFAHTSLELSDLEAEDAERLVELRLGADEVPAALQRFVRERAGGHPLFIEEALKALIEARAVVVEDRKVTQAKSGHGLALPRTLRGLVASRIGRLAPEHRTVLQAAAVLSDPVDVATLAAMVQQNLGGLERVLTLLAGHGLIVRTGPSELRFASPLVRECVVDALPDEAHKAMHLAAADAIANTLGEHAWEHAARVAAHYADGGAADTAAGYFARSAERRLEAGQFESAAREYACALDAHDPAVRRLDEVAKWLSGLASAARIVRSAPDAPALCERIIARADREGSDELRVRVRIDAGRLLSFLHHFDAAHQRLDEAERVGGANAAWLKAVLMADVELAGRQGDFKQSHELLERLETLAVAYGDKYEEHKILVGLTQAHAANGNSAAAWETLGRADELLPNDPAAVCERYKLRGLVYYFARDYEKAAEAAERAVELARELGVPFEVAANLHNLGDVLLRHGDFGRAYGALRQSLAQCDESGFERLANLNRAFLAFLDGAAGGADAEAAIVQGIRYAEANDFTWDVLGCRALLAQLLARKEDPRAKDEYERLRTLARAAGHRVVLEDCDAVLKTMSQEPGDS